MSILAKLILVQAGCVVAAMAIIWATAYACHVLPTWAEIPALFSGIIGFGCCFAGFVGTARLWCDIRGVDCDKTQPENEQKRRG